MSVDFLNHGPNSVDWFRNFDSDAITNMSEAHSSFVTSDFTSNNQEDITVDSTQNAVEDSTPDIGDSIAENTVEELGTDLVADSAAGALSSMVDPVMIGIASGMMVSDITQSVNQMHISDVESANVSKSGVGAATESQMISQRLNAESNSMHTLMTGGAFLGGPIGAALGYAFAPHLDAANLNFNIAYSSGGKVDPELQNTVASGYTSTPSDSNPNIMTTS